MWYRLFLPSWDFFAQTGHRARVEIRFHDTDFWRPLRPPVKRKFWHLFFNPEGNAHHWAQRTGQELLLVLGSLDDPKNLVATSAYKIILAEAESLARNVSSPDFMLRLVAIDSQGQEEVIITSPIQTLLRSK